MKPGDDTALRAARAARDRYGPETWLRMASCQRAAAVYAEMRRLDALVARRQSAPDGEQRAPASVRARAGANEAEHWAERSAVAVEQAKRCRAAALATLAALEKVATASLGLAQDIRAAVADTNRSVSPPSAGRHAALATQPSAAE